MAHDGFFSKWLDKYANSIEPNRIYLTVLNKFENSYLQLINHLENDFKQAKEKVYQEMQDDPSRLDLKRDYRDTTTEYDSINTRKLLFHDITLSLKCCSQYFEKVSGEKVLSAFSKKSKRPYIEFYSQKYLYDLAPIDKEYYQKFYKMDYYYLEDTLFHPLKEGSHDFSCGEKVADKLLTDLLIFFDMYIILKQPKDISAKILIDNFLIDIGFDKETANNYIPNILHFFNRTLIPFPKEVKKLRIGKYEECTPLPFHVFNFLISFTKKLSSDDPRRRFLALNVISDEKNFPIPNIQELEEFF